ncbi:hypothetical protein [Intestinimonas massiliensis (ex Afouda et al. 2020)]|uniref:hypothetical protein n=1 Tax=Intestinimonas massiliensis (ex Afouda et al. 2020) TaxID=1673721 RepID=UPI0010312898|nr:hypothetical protein [Intestinimonas massiliensis (ex Afouda et al. 2020)]
MKNITKSAAQIAREHNISPQLLRNRIKKGMSIEDAVKECINIRDARAASGSAPHKSSRPCQGEIQFAGETYASFSAACQALGLRESSAYAKRKRLMNDGYSLESASRTVLEEAATRGVQRRKRTPVIINGISYDSQLEAAGALGLSMGSINARRTRDKLSFEDAVQVLLDSKSADFIYGTPAMTHPWPEFRDAICGNQDYQLAEDGNKITAKLSLPGNISISYTISMTVSGFLSFYFQDLDFLASYDLNELNCRYIGAKFFCEANNTVSVRYDMPVIGRVQSDLAQFFKVRNFIYNIISSLINQ